MRQHKCSAKQEFDHNCVRDANTTDAIKFAGHDAYAEKGSAVWEHTFQSLIIPPEIYHLTYYSKSNEVRVLDARLSPLPKCTERR